MKKIHLILTSLFFSLLVFAQTNTYNPNYMYTSFEENFIGNQLDDSVWKKQSHWKRGLGMLIDSSLTIDVSNNNLNLSMHPYP